MLAISLTLVRRTCRRPFPLWIVLAIAIGYPCPRTDAQQGPEFAIQGYVTAVQSVNHFDVDGKHVETSPATTWQIMDKTSLIGSDWLPQAAAQVGAYLRVAGPTNRHTHIIHAEEISLRDDRDKKLSGIGVIDRVLEAGPQPTFRADGYRIRITPATNVAFSGDLKSLQDIVPGTWLHFEGKLDKAGLLVAVKVNFLQARPSGFKAIPVLEVNKLTLTGTQPPSAQSGSTTAHEAPAENNEPASRASAQPEAAAEQKVSPSQHGGHFKEVEDPVLQARVQRIGMAVVPAYQKALPDDHHSKIPFRFVAVDNNKYRSEVCSVDGLILVPRQVLERLKSDDQLAAVLADGVAYDLQRQAARVIQVNRTLTSAAIAADIAGVFVPGLSLVALATLAPEHKLAVAMDEERGRIALALLSDAGYDPWQAPEAWRLLAPKHLPSSLDGLGYPNYSGYQFGVLNRQYRESALLATSAPSAQAIQAR